MKHILITSLLAATFATAAEQPTAGHGPGAGPAHSGAARAGGFDAARPFVPSGCG